MDLNMIFTISRSLLGNLGVDLNHPPKFCARLGGDLLHVAEVHEARLDVAHRGHRGARAVTDLRAPDLEKHGARVDPARDGYRI